MTRRRALAAAGVLVAAAGAAGAWAGASLLGSGPAQASRPTGAAGTAVVHRQDLAVTEQVNGELGYRATAPVVNRLAGTYTALPAEGSVVGRGQALYQVDASPVVLMYGRQPAWRALAAGIPEGADVAVLERRGEIGLRRALGATRRHIAMQFLAEALLLSLLGGAAGVVAGWLLTAAYAHQRHWPATVPPAAVAGGLTAALVIGAAAGLYPAMRAARLAPTEALRAT